MKTFELAVLLCLGYGASAYVLFRHEWTKLILTHHWPQAFCSMEHCNTHIGYWTLHGLWPDKGIACNSSWHFNASLIEDIMPEMEKFWTNLISPTSKSFWKYEWYKHGTCAAKAETLNSQHKYFSKALELYHKLDLDGTLKKSNIVPSDHHYSLDDVEGAIFQSYNVKPRIQCIHPGQGGQYQTLGQIEICFNTDFEVTDCERSVEDIWSRANDILSFVSNGYRGFSVCDKDMPIYYPPLIGKW